MEVLDHQLVTIPSKGRRLHGELYMPLYASALVIFADGNGLFSHRDRQIAYYFQKHGLGSFLFDLLTEEENNDAEIRLNMPLLTDRLVSVTRWLSCSQDIGKLPIAFFGAGVGAAVALNASIILPLICAVVLKGRCPDLASNHVKVTAPVLVLTGNPNTSLFEVNIATFNALECEKKLEVVEEATPLFEERGKMEELAALAATWFLNHIPTKI